jgi:Zn-dependent protease with chaperone function
VKIGPDQFPELHDTVERLAKRIGFTETPEAYVMQAGGILNALATKLFRSKFVILYSDLLEACGNNTSARDMIIAHELGHIKEGHLDWHWFLLPGLLVPFLGTALSRAREYTCDRYGLAGAGQKEDALRGLAILAAGAERGPKVNLKAMASQMEDLNAGWLTLGSWLATHPPLSARVIALEDSLKPAGYNGQRGMLRALGIIGAVYVTPTLIMIVAFSFLSAMNLAKQRESALSVPDALMRYDVPEVPPDVPNDDHGPDE